MTAPLHIDVESRSACDLLDTNAYVYFEDPTTDLWCASYVIGDGEPEIWFPPDPCPDEIVDHVRSGGVINAWNAAFERIAWRELLGPRYGWPVPRLEQYRCTMVKAYALSLPGKLENAAPALGLDTVKDAAGHRLMLQLSKPRRPRKNEAPGLYWWDEAEKLDRLAEYCKQDVRTERAVDSRVLPLSEFEQQLWVLDQKINDRGVAIDADLCNRCKLIVADASKKLNDELAELTGYEVMAVTNTTQMKLWLQSRGVPCDGVAKDAVELLLARDDLPADAQRVLEIRQEGGKSSVAKLDAMLDRRQRDGRMRGNLQFSAASTRRWAGRGAQLQNLPRPTTEDDLTPLIDDIAAGMSADTISMLYGPPLTMVSDVIRGMIIAGSAAVA